MNFDVAVNGRPWKIAIEAAEQPGQFTIVVKGRKRVVDASWIDRDTLSLIDGPAARDVRIHRRHDGSLGVAFGGRMLQAVVAAERQKRIPDPFRSGSADGRHGVKSPMPGRIVRVLVAAGDRVAAHQPLVIVEAMKMENELRSPVDGVVTDVNVSEGAVIEGGAVVVVVQAVDR